ncbi:hypothetical protein IMZ29_16535 [Achromobacter sp. GG226]|uniref:hypothetical protein n=1 Tax=Verticiella alkaliphila TaxID=2779529 RepID=UPI001C0D9C4B|nr:hypothetical protein [Verticiella sp. GG226]MBU4612088.1 hypothetical protein [Verticiella sp. GG226]
MRAVVLLRVGLALSIALAFMWLGATTYRLSLEDYHPRPGTWLFRTGLSALVRNAPVELALGSPDYFGSVGDGAKLPQSEVSMMVAPTDREAAQLAWQAHLHDAGFAPAVPQPDALAPGETAYVGPKGQAAILGSWREPGGELLLMLRHYD